MKMVRLNKRAASLSALVVTLPLLAILCRGYAPKPYDPINLPFWERDAPNPVIVPIPLPDQPVATQLSQDSPLVKQLLNVDEDKLLASVEQPIGTSYSNKADGEVGTWLTEASYVTSTTPDFSAKQDRIAIRLLTAQQPNGYFGEHAGKDPISAAEYLAQAKALTGLISYFRITRSPVVVLSILRSGDYLTSLSTQGTQNIPNSVYTQFVSPLANLYLQTGASKYLHCAEAYATVDGADIPGLCALYSATGNKKWLGLAESKWRSEVHSKAGISPDDSSALYRVTMNPKFLLFSPMHAVALDPDLQFGILKSGVLVTPITSATAASHGFNVGVAALPAETKVVMASLPKSKHPLTLRVLALCNQPYGKPLMVNITDKKGKALANTAVKSDTYLVLNRAWHNGDTVTIAPFPAQVAHAIHPKASGPTPKTV